MAELHDDLIKIAYLMPLVQALLPLGLVLHRLLGIAGITWVNSRLRSL